MQVGREGIIVEKEAEELLERLVDGNVSELSDLDDENDKTNEEAQFDILVQDNPSDLAVEGMDEEINEYNDVLPEGEERENNANVINEGENLEERRKNDHYHQGLLRGTTSSGPCQALPKEKRLSVDEQMVPLKGHHGSKQFNPKKPILWDLKTTELNASHQLDYGLGPSVVLHLAGNTPFMSLTDMQARGRGTMQKIVSEDKDVVMTRWFDNKPVNMVSNIIGVGTPDLATRWDKDQKNWLEYKRDCDLCNISKKKVMVLMEFHMSVVTNLVEVGRTLQSPGWKIGRPSSADIEAQQPHKAPKNYESRPSKAVQFDTVDHLPVHSGKKEAGRCKSKVYRVSLSSTTPPPLPLCRGCRSVLSFTLLLNPPPLPLSRGCRSVFSFTLLSNTATDTSLSRLSVSVEFHSPPQHRHRYLSVEAVGQC
ncbi:hypothetical protein J6590_077587 [Homalodisca vitripennis]|nr:hypothetical protein J6590_077587 [Homalodisca vitripennis]